MDELKRVDIMTDIETLGHRSDSTIIQISAIAFDIETGEHIEVFNKIADITKNKTMNVTGSTIKWWLNTNKELLADLVNSGIGSSEDILRDFYIWLTSVGEPNELHLWGNGILFDNKMIQHQLELVEKEYPISYKNDRDVRTIVDLAGKKLGLTEKELKDKLKDDSLVAHNALDDVKLQINLVVECYKVLTKEAK
ncbi:3'-5' exonuclease [Bacillus toyonensis]|uniref:3'-5' exonuclease n=1 Tax=Bacillus toyonensis TaxID=155322 RepID=UPI00124EF938|nr:3'-5' exonuclease [Bacillus toyonensis]KAB2380186.1 3'-5' exoribonuclease [Bacillus toyonensis]